MQKILTNNHKSIFTLVLLFTVVLFSGAENLLSGWDANKTSGTNTEPNKWGWKCTPNDLSNWIAANGTSGVRYLDVTHSLAAGGSYTGRTLVIRWDGVDGSTTSTVYSYKNTYGSTIKPLHLTPGKYKFSFLYEWWNNASNPVLTVGFGLNNTGSYLASKDFTCSTTKNLLTRGEIVFDVVTENDYYLTIKNKSANASMCAVADLNLDLYDGEIVTSVDNLAFDDKYNSASLTVSQQGLKSDIVINAPAGITVSPQSIPMGSAAQKVTVTYDGKTSVDGELVLTSGNVTNKVTVKAVKTGDCFEPATTLVNLVKDPYMNDMSLFTGTGSWTPITITTKPAISGVPYCGCSSVKIGDGVSTSSGSVSVPNISWKDFTIYRVIAKVKTTGTCRMILNGVDGPGTSRVVMVPSTYGAWDVFDHTIITGKNVKVGNCTFTNSEGSTATTAYIDNWEIYEIPTEGI
jgi:hypothetical protein